MAGKKQSDIVTTRATEKQLESFEFNYAQRADTSARFMDQVRDTLQTTRSNRLTLEEQWIEDMRQWSCIPNQEGYAGYSNIFVPEVHNQIENSTERALSAIFPGPDYIYAVAMQGMNQEEADKIKAAVLYELDVRNNIFLKQDEHQRQKIITGTSVFKGGFKKEMVEIFVREKETIGRDGKVVVGKPRKVEIPKWHGTTWDVVDLFRWYIYPETSTLDDCLMVFEDQFYNLTKAKNSGLYMNLDEITPISHDTKHQWADIERLNMANLYTAFKARPGCALFTEIWTEFEIRKGLTVPVVGTIANDNTVVRLTRNPFWFQSHPYCASRYVRRPGKVFYGLSLPDKIRSQGYQMNDVMNQTQDSLNYSLSPIVVVDPALAGDLNSMKMAPGEKWLGSPEGIAFQAFPDVSGSGLRMAQEIRGQIAQFSDSTPGVAPQLQGKSRSATQATIVQGAVSQRQRVQSKGEEAEVMEPMCWKTHIMLQQFMEEAYEIRIQGPDNGEWITKEVSPADLVGKVDFVWKGSDEAEKTAVYTQQLLAFYNAALQTAAVMPGEVDLTNLFIRVGKEAFKLKDMDVLFKSLRDKKTVDPDIENIALMNAQEVQINNGDDDDLHLEVHLGLLDNPDLTDEQKLAIVKHSNKHEAQKKAKAQVLQLQSRLKAVQMAQQGGEQGGGVDGRQMPQPPGIGEGNGAQAMSSPDAIMTSVRGVDSQV